MIDLEGRSIVAASISFAPALGAHVGMYFFVHQAARFEALVVLLDLVVAIPLAKLRRVGPQHVVRRLPRHTVPALERLLCSLSLIIFLTRCLSHSLSLSLAVCVARCLSHLFSLLLSLSLRFLSLSLPFVLSHTLTRSLTHSISLVLSHSLVRSLTSSHSCSLSLSLL